MAVKFQLSDQMKRKSSRLLFMVLLSFLAIACSSPLKSFHRAIEKAPYDVIIVPGIPYQNQDWASNIMKARILWSFYLYSKRITLNVIYSGNAVYTPYVEGKIMALHAAALGIPVEHIFSETKAEHSTENLVYSYQMAKRMGFKKIAVATDPFQSVTLNSFAWDRSIPVDFIPIVNDSLNTMKTDSSLHVDPLSAFVGDFIPLPQRENFLKRILGTMGLEMGKTGSE
jgi:uncharacterized SAM-binding protein YcdF (DUF218 family)